MATITLGVTTPGSGTSNSFRSNARVRLTYSTGAGTATVSKVECLAGNGYRTWSSGSLKINLGSASKTVSGTVDFGANSYTTFTSNFGITGSTSNGKLSVSVTVQGATNNILGTVFSGTISGVPLPVTTPSLSALNISSISDKSAYFQFSVSNNGGASIKDSYIDVSLTNFGTAVKTLSSASGIISGLDAGRTYYARGNASNGSYRGFTGVKSFTTKYNNPKPPTSITITGNTPDLNRESTVNINWSGAEAGSTPILGYHITIYKNDTQVYDADIDSINTVYSFLASTYELEEYDTIYATISSYSKDYSNKLYRSTTATSSVVTVDAPRYCWVSENGQAFKKRQVFMSQNGNKFLPVKKGW